MDCIGPEPSAYMPSFDIARPCIFVLLPTGVYMTLNADNVVSYTKQSMS